jgi:hypothetical protein
MESLAEARAFARDCSFWVSPEVMTFNLPIPLAGGVTAGKKRLRISGKKLLIEFLASSL